MLEQRRRWRALAGLTFVMPVLAACGAAAGSSSPSSTGVAAADEAVTAIHGPAPDFTLTDQVGQPVSMHDLRGKVVILAFTDAQCTTVCPLTTEAMAQSLKLLGGAAAGVQLVGVNTNPAANSVTDVAAYSVAHGLRDQWLFLTGSVAQLQAVWAEYHVFAGVEQGSVVHTAAVFVIDAAGHQRDLLMSPMEYAAVPQQAEILAGAAARLLPTHPHVLPVTIPGHLLAGHAVTLPAIAGLASAPAVRLGASRQLVVFWASWVPGAPTQLAALSQYATDAQARGLPPLVAVDEAPTEPSPDAAGSLVEAVAPVLYTVAVDGTGRVADLYGVGDLPWFVLSDSHAHVRWTHDGWMDVDALEAAVAKAGA